jgi:hypothetical protein
VTSARLFGRPFNVCGVHALACALALGYAGAHAGAAFAAEPTPGYPEAVIQWGVQKGETCDDIAKVVYGSPMHAGLLHRYNRVTCGPGAALPEGLTLVLPAEVTSVPDAKIRSMNPDVRARPAGGAWAPATPGMPLRTNANVNTLDRGRADIEFVDRTRVFLAPNTLVVIYGTASRARVSKAPPAVVEIESGEVKAALAALRGESVEVAVEGGARVSASSRDTVVQRKGERTTVAVFDGKAGVTSGGRAVQVPKDHGTRFVGAAPPAPPRPLPPAPEWSDGSDQGVALAPAGAGVLSASWKPVAGAIGYRVEVGRDAAFDDLLVREEVPPDISSFRVEKMPVGNYWLRVRVIDREEYLGVAAVRALRLVAVAASRDVVPSAKEISANPYGFIELAPAPDLEMAMDQGPFGPVPERIDLVQRAPRALRLRERGAAAEASIPVRYTEVGASIEAAQAPRAPPERAALDVRVALSGLEGLTELDVAQRVAPRLRAHFAGGVVSVPLAPGGGGALSAVVPLPAAARDAALPLRVRLDVVDGHGSVLGTRDVDLPGAPAATAACAEAPGPVIGAFVPLLPLSSLTDTLWLGPTPPSVVALGAGASSGAGAWVAQGQVRATGAVGPLGLDLALRSNGSGDSAVGSDGWLGLRYRAPRLGRSGVELAPVLRLGVPLVDASPPVRVEPGLAVGGALGRFTWVVDAGVRIRARDDGGKAGAPPSQGFLLAGATADPLSWLRLHAALDLHLVHRDSGVDDALGAIAAGAEAGGAVFGALSLRVSPRPEPGEGSITGQLAIGVREASP